MRGLLPRSFRIDPTDPLYGTPYATNAYAYDNALALIATSKPRPALASEDLEGILQSMTYPATLPFTSNHIDASAVGSYIQNNACAIMAYAIGYYMEMNPSTFVYCTAEEYLRNLLNYLQSQRDWKYNAGLIIDGRDTSGILTEDIDYITVEDESGILVTENSLASSVRTEDNILAWYAFRQAAKVFDEPNYQTTADELKDAIMTKLWSNTENKFWFGLTINGTPIAVNVLMVSAYGSLFMHEINEPAKALLCLQKCEVFSCVDDSIGVKGYKTWIKPENTVNFEMSYAVALGYIRAGNVTKATQIRNELNRFVDPTDGGVRGSLVKKYLDEDLIDRKAVGSTSWAIIANNLEATAFTVRSNVFTPVAPCSPVWFNEEQHEVFTKEGCPVDYHGSTYDYIVPAGRYVSYISQADANEQATLEIFNNGQDYVNTNGQCIPDAAFGNQVAADYFINQTCPFDTTPTAVLFTVPPDTYFAATQAEADELAAAYLETAGQAYANANGSCVPTTGISIILLVRYEYIAGSYFVYSKALSSAPMPINARVYYNIYSDGTPGAPVIVPPTFLQFTAGDTQTPEKLSGSFTDVLGFDISGVISNVSPNHSGTILFNW